jgi:hypothetical protein
LLPALFGWAWVALTVGAALLVLAGVFGFRTIAGAAAGALAGAGLADGAVVVGAGVLLCGTVVEGAGVVVVGVGVVEVVVVGVVEVVVVSSPASLRPDSEVAPVEVGTGGFEGVAGACSPALSTAGVDCASGAGSPPDAAVFGPSASAPADHGPARQS